MYIYIYIYIYIIPYTCIPGATGARGAPLGSAGVGGRAGGAGAAPLVRGAGVALPQRGVARRSATGGRISARADRAGSICIDKDICIYIYR